MKLFDDPLHDEFASGRSDGAKASAALGRAG